jgi:hypothetical protein
VSATGFSITEIAHEVRLRLYLCYIRVRMFKWVSTLQSVRVDVDSAWAKRRPYFHKKYFQTAYISICSAGSRLHVLTLYIPQ